MPQDSPSPAFYPGLHALVRASRLMAQEPDPARAVGILVGALREDLGIERAGIFIHDQHQGALERVYGIDRTGYPETGQELSVVDEAPAGVPPNDLPAQPSVFAPDYAPEEIAQIARKLRKSAGLPDEPTGVVATEVSLSRS